MTTTAAIYARISADPNATALGVTRQVTDCQALADSRGWTVAETYVDNDVSATSGKPRPQYAAMMDALAAGRVTALVCWDVDRLTRTPRELEDVVDLAERRGVALASVGGEIDLATPQGRLTARIKGSVAKHESEQLGRRVRRKLDERAESGAPHGRTAYGWRREQVYDDQGRRQGSRDVIHPGQAAVIRDAAAGVIAGESLRSLTATLNDQGETTITGKPWTPASLRSTLLRERNAGWRVHRGEVIGKGEWEAVLDEDTLRQVVAILTDPERRTSPASSAVKYLLSGLARCGVCDGPMRVLTAGKDGRTRDTYVCHKNYCTRRSLPDVDDLVTRVVVARLARPDAAGALAAGDSADAQEAADSAAAVRARLDTAADSFAAGDIDGRQLARITARLRPELDQWEQVVRAATTTPDLIDLATPDIAQRWDGLPLARKRAVIDLLVRIEIHRLVKHSSDFDPETVMITWKDAE